MALAPGSTLGQYEIVSLLGAGGMGEVYRARDTRLGREVAVKLLLEEVSSDRRRLARFEHEARALASVNHANVATLHGFETAGDTRFLVMELVAGETLAERIARGRVPPDEVVTLALQIARGLQAAYEQGVVHRDLKPENIKLSDSDEVKILDFGLAKATAVTGEPAGGQATGAATLPADTTRPGTLLGTVAYMSPEQASGEPADHRSDIWAFGCVLYELLTGRRAFAGRTALETMTSVLSSEPDWQRLPSATPPGLRQLLIWSLRKEPTERLQHIGDGRILLADIRDRGPLARLGSGPDRGPAGQWKLALPAAVAVFLAAAGLTWLALRSDAPPSRPPAPYDWSLRPLTATGDAWNVALSPDGGTVAYLSAEGLVTQDVSGGDSNLVLADPDWGLSTQKKRLGRPHGEPRWLHDGAGVAFGMPMEAASWRISAVPRMGGPIQPKLTVELRGGESFASLQSLDDDVYLLARTLEDKRAAPWIRWVENGVQQGIELPDDIEDLWDAVGAPGWDWVAYIGEREDRTTVVGTVSRTSARQNVIVERRSELSKWQEMSTTRHWAGNRIMRWPAGNRFYYREMSTRGLDIFAVTLDRDTGRALDPPELIYSGLPPGASFDVARDGTRVAYSGGVIKTQLRVFRFDRRRGGPPLEEWQLTAGTARHVAPRFSPDGRRIAYIRKTRGSQDIYVAPLGGGEAERLYVLYDWTRLIDLKWGPRGDELFVFADTSSGARLLRILLSDARVAEIETRPPRGIWFDLSPDGTKITYGIRSDAAYLVQELITGEQTELLTDSPGEKIQALFSPDGDQLLVNNIGQASAGLWLTTVDGENPRRVTTEASGRTAPIAWSDDGTVYVLGEAGTVSALDTADGTLQELGSISEVPVWDGWASIHLSGDDLYLACAVDEPRESDVWIMDRVE